MKKQYKPRELIGMREAVLKSVKDFPTYDDLRKEHSRVHKLKEMMQKLGMC